MFPTTVPEETLRKAISLIKNINLNALGVGSFGPLELDPMTIDYGSITNTPKTGWSWTNVFPTLRHELDNLIAIDPDVNVTAVGELSLVPENNLLVHFVYFSIGPVIGAGIISNGKVMHGLIHPEVGHLRIPHDRFKDPYQGNYPFHKDCFECLASSPALAARWDQSADDLPDDHPAWEIEAENIASALVNIILTVSPQTIILGGEVMKRKFLFPLIRQKVSLLLNKTILTSTISEHLDKCIAPPYLPEFSCVLGAIALEKAQLNGTHD